MDHDQDLQPRPAPFVSMIAYCRDTAKMMTGRQNLPRSSEIISRDKPKNPGIKPNFSALRSGALLAWAGLAVRLVDELASKHVTSIPFLFPTPGANPQTGAPLTNGNAGTGQAGEGIFASLVAFGDDEGGAKLSGAARLLATIAESAQVRLPNAQILPADIRQKLAELLGDNADTLSPELLSGLQRSDDDNAERLLQVIADLLQPQSEQAAASDGDQDDAILTALQQATLPIAQQTPSEGSDAGETQGAADVSTTTAGNGTPVDKALRAALELIAGGAENAPAGGNSETDVTLSAAQTDGDEPNAPGVPGDAARVASDGVRLVPAADELQKTGATRGAQPDAGASSTANVAANGAQQEKRPAHATDKSERTTGLERALERSADQAQPRLEANLARHAQAPSREGLDLQLSDTADLGTPQAAADASRTVRLSAQISNNGQAQLPIAQLAVQIATHARAGTNRFSIRLDPPELGKIDIRLEVSHDGNVASRLSVERPETLDLLLRDARALERALNDAGLKTGSGSLQFSLKGEGFAQHQDRDTQRQGGQSESNLLTGIDAINDGAALANVRHFVASSGLNIVV